MPDNTAVNPVIGWGRNFYITLQIFDSIEILIQLQYGGTGITAQKSNGYIADRP